MQMENSRTSYGAFARTLHWLIATLIVVQFLLAPIPENLPPGIHVDPPFGLDKLGLLMRHKSFGMTVLMLMLLRVIWRWRSPPPALPPQMKTAERGLARVSHIAFYVILLAMPVSGLLMSSAKGFSTTWFNVWTWPNLIGRNEQAFDVLRTTHDTLSRVLFFLALLHILAALKHHFWNKDSVLVRMLPFSKITK